MKARIARGITLALAGCWVTASAHAQLPLNGPYGPTPAAYSSRAYGTGVESPAEPSLLSEGPEQQAPAPPTPEPEKDDASPWQGYKNSGSGYADEGGYCGLGGCCDDGCCMPFSYSPCCGNWFAGAYGLIMDRDDENNLWLSYDTDDITCRILNSRDADMDWSGGFETRFGRYFNCGNSAVEAVYWGVFANPSEANVYASNVSGDLATALRFDNLVYDYGTGPQSVDSLYNAAQRHRLIRSNEFHNVELNFLSFCAQPCCNLRLGWAAGVRYFRFDEGFQYSADPTDTEFTGAPEEINLNIDVLNQLVGAQVGGRADYLLCNCFSVFADTKVGLYNNHINYSQHLAGDFGPAWVDDPTSPYDGGYIDVCGKKDDVSILAELNLGSSYQVTRCFSVTGGYRAVAVTGMALATNQIPTDDIANFNSTQSVESNGDLILHGAYAGLEFNY